jgi:transposase-like protein
MTSNDVAVATPPDETSAQRPDRSLAEQLVEQAKADGRSLVGPGGLLADLTKQVLETGLEVEMEEHVVTRSTRRRAAITATAGTGRARRR